MLTYEQISLAAQHLATVVDPWVFIMGYANHWTGCLLYIATKIYVQMDNHLFCMTLSSQYCYLAGLFFLFLCLLLLLFLSLSYISSREDETGTPRLFFRHFFGISPSWRIRGFRRRLSENLANLLAD
jgi:hypothetical protein